MYRLLPEVRDLIVDRLEKKQFRSALASVRDSHDMRHLKQIIQDQNINPLALDRAARGDSSIAYRLFGLDIGQSDTVIEDNAINLVTLTDIKERHVQPFSQVQELVRHDMALNAAQKHLDDLVNDSRKSPALFAQSAIKPDESYDVWFDRNDQDALLGLMQKNLPLEYMARLDKEGMFLVHGNEQGGYLIALSAVGMGSKPASSRD